MSEEILHDINLAELAISQPGLTTSAFIPETEEFTGTLAEIMPSNDVWAEASELFLVNVNYSLAEVITKLVLEGKNPPMRGASRLSTAIGIGIGM